jgi:hypothetical protein
MPRRQFQLKFFRVKTPHVRAQATVNEYRLKEESFEKTNACRRHKPTAGIRLTKKHPDIRKIGPRPAV